MKKLSLVCLLALITINPALAAPAAVHKPASRAMYRSSPNLVRQSPSTDAAAGQAYSARLWNRVLSQWNYPDGTNHVTVSAVVTANGDVESVQTSSSPKSPDAETSAQSAFEKAKPLDALPRGMAKAKLVITFNSKSDPHGDSSSGGSVRLDPIAGSTAAPQAVPEVTDSAPDVKKDAPKETVKETAKETPKEPVKEAPKEPAKEPEKDAFQ